MQNSKIKIQNDNSKLIKTLNGGGVAVIPTDTIYGIVGQAQNRQTVERIYKIKKRAPEKPFIILISNAIDLEKFGVYVNEFQKRFLNKYWPGSVSIVLPSSLKDLEYLNRGTNQLAFRLPDDVALRSLIEITSSLVAPSANPEGLAPASDIKMAKKYFGREVDYYDDDGVVEGPPSTLVLLEKDKYIVLREGAVKVK